jgi:branched-chain amino acid transport system substrate-binding protein
MRPIRSRPSRRAGGGSGTPIKIAIMSECKGAFGSFDNQNMAGAVSALSQFAGAKPKNPNKPRDGFTGGAIGDHPLKLVGVGCGDDTSDTAIKETAGSWSSSTPTS